MRNVRRSISGREVEPLPRRYSYVTRRGTRIHRRIELHHQGKVPLLEPDSEDPDLADDDRPVGPSTGPGPFEVFLESRFSDMETQWLEKAFNLRLGERFLVRGRIDAVYRRSPSHWEIVDFKSGQPPAGGPAFHPPGPAAGLRPGRQRDSRTGSAAIQPLGDHRPTWEGGRLREVPGAAPVDQAWLASARTRLEDMARSIVERQWDPTPSPDCVKCDFFRLCPEGRTFIASIGQKR